MFSDDLGVQVIGLFRPNYVDVLSINEIASRLGKKYPYVHKRVKGMISEGILNVTRMGRSHLCSLNLSHPLVSYILGYHHLVSVRSHFSDQVLEELQARVLERLPSLQSLVFEGAGRTGSVLYAMGDGKEPFELTGYRVQPVSRAEVSGLLLDTSTSFFSSHRVVMGFDHFFRLVRDNERELKLAYNPLVEKIL